MIRSRGRKPSWTACLATEKEPVSAAWEAMIVASVANTTIGTSRLCGMSWKNGLNDGLLTLRGCARMNAAWPR